MKNRIYLLLVLATIVVGCTSQKNLKESFSPIWSETPFTSSDHQGWIINFDTSFNVSPEFSKVSSSVIPWGPYITWNRKFEQTFSNKLYADTLEQITSAFFEDPQNRAHLYFKHFNINVLSGPSKILIQDKGHWFLKKHENPVIFPDASPLVIEVKSEKWSKTYTVPVRLKTLRKQNMTTRDWSNHYKGRERRHMGSLYSTFLLEFEQDLQKY
ncbi:MAG: PBP1b-binding outer membrane lipoprotein LpoB [Sphingobacteriales bacterium]|jgi:PBP1b-binding outer membrane lipoprotein LpoB